MHFEKSVVGWNGLASHNSAFIDGVTCDLVLVVVVDSPSLVIDSVTCALVLVVVVDRVTEDAQISTTTHSLSHASKNEAQQSTRDS